MPPDKHSAGPRANFEAFTMRIRPKSGPEARFPAREEHHCVTGSRMSAKCGAPGPLQGQGEAHDAKHVGFDRCPLQIHLCWTYCFSTCFVFGSGSTPGLTSRS